MMRYRALFALLVPLALGGDYTPTAMDDSSIRTAVAAWLSNATAAEAAYGHGVKTSQMFEGAACTLRDPFRKCNVRVRVLSAFGGCALL